MLDSLQYNTAPADESGGERTFPPSALTQTPQQSQYFESSGPQSLQARQYANYENELQDESSMYEGELPFDAFGKFHANLKY